VPQEVVLAIWGFEKGPPGYEFGHRGRTPLFAKHLPPNQYQYVEAARSMNQFAWEWFNNTVEGQAALPKMIKFCGMRYGGPSDAERVLWGKNVLLNIEKFKEKP